MDGKNTKQGSIELLDTDKVLNFILETEAVIEAVRNGEMNGDYGEF